MNFRVIEHGCVDSTSERAFAALADGTARDGDVHVAVEQTHGRGRLGARWESVAGGGLYASLVLKPARALPHPAAITMTAGLCVRAALAEVGLADAQLKWPNDVLVHGAKIAGILVETRGLVPSAPHCVVGVGVNVAQRSFSTQLAQERAVTSLALQRVECSPDRLLATLLEGWPTRWGRALDAPEGVAREYWSALDLAGTQVHVREGSQRFEGLAQELTISAGLVLECADERVVIPLERIRSITSAHHA